MECVSERDTHASRSIELEWCESRAGPHAGPVAQRRSCCVHMAEWEDVTVEPGNHVTGAKADRVRSPINGRDETGSKGNGGRRLTLTQVEKGRTWDERPRMCAVEWDACARQTFETCVQLCLHYIPPPSPTTTPPILSRSNGCDDAISCVLCITPNERQ